MTIFRTIKLWSYVFLLIFFLAWTILISWWKRCSIYSAFLHKRHLVFYYRSLSDKLFPQIFKTIMRILTDLICTVILRKSILPPISSFQRLVVRLLEIVSMTQTTTAITVVVLFQNVFNCPTRPRSLTNILLSSLFTPWYIPVV